MIRLTGLAPWEFEFPFPGNLTSNFLVRGTALILSALPPGAFTRRPYLTQRVFEVVLQKPILTQIRQLILHISNSKGHTGYELKSTFGPLGAAGNNGRSGRTG